MIAATAIDAGAPTGAPERPTLAPRELDEYRPARVALDELALSGDAVSVHRHGPGSWLVSVLDAPLCAACEGTGRDLERPDAPCRRCRSGRVGVPAVSRRYVVATDGRVRAAGGAA
jgi:hypothetical protein